MVLKIGVLPGDDIGLEVVPEAARLIDAAVDRVIAEAKHLTRDLGGSASTTEMGDAIAAAV